MATAINALKPILWRSAGLDLLFPPRQLKVPISFLFSSLGPFQFYTKQKSESGITGSLTTYNEQTVAGTRSASYAFRLGQDPRARNRSWESLLHPYYLFYYWRALGGRNPARIGGFCRVAPCS